MLVDFILDRMEGVEYDPRELYDYCQEEEIYWGVARALDGGDNEDVRRELCGYILANGYNPEICGILAVWIGRNDLWRVAWRGAQGLGNNSPKGRKIGRYGTGIYYKSNL